MAAVDPGGGRRRLERQGVGLVFEEAGCGERAVILVHGWACDRSYFAPQIRHLAERHRVIAVDLRGHGESDAPQQVYGMDAFADDVSWLCRELGIGQAVIVGHSMGGVIALELAARQEGLVSAIVALDAPMVLPPERLAKLRRAGAAFGTAEFAAAVRRLVEGMFLPTDDPELRARIVERMCSRPQHVLASAWERLFASPYASSATAPPIPVPVLAVAAAGGHMADLSRLATLTRRLVVAQTVGAGHFHQLQAPGQINDMIDRFLAAVDAHE